MFASLLIATTLTTNVLAGKTSLNGLRFHRHDDVNKYGDQVAAALKRGAGSCQTKCQEDRDLCLNNVDMDDFAEKFMCLSQYGTCRKKKCSSGKRETIQNDDDDRVAGSFEEGSWKLSDEMSRR